MASGFVGGSRYLVVEYMTSIKNSSAAFAQERLKAVGERQTSARLAVLTLLLDAPNAVTHQDIADQLKNSGEQCDRVTLYRVLDWLVAHRLAHKMAGEDRVWRFNAVLNEQHIHPHFHCVECGKVSCLDSVHVDITTLPNGYRTVSADTTIQGMCPDCSP
jgi:Fur family ferric uptake transcriptional regulator